MTSSRWQHSFRRLIWLARVVGLLLLATVAVVLDMTATERHRAEVRQQWQERLDGLSLRLQSLILQNIQTVWGVAANVAVDPDIDDPRFQELASPRISSFATSIRWRATAPPWAWPSCSPPWGCSG